MDEMERPYTTKDLADMLGVEAVTIRKYAMALEKAGYGIDRSVGNNRSYSERDAMAFKYMQTIRSRTGITVEAAADVVATKNKTDMVHNGNIVHSGEGNVIDRYDERYAMLEAALGKLTEIVLQQQEQIAAATEQLSGRISDVSDSLRDEIRKGQQETSEQLGEILSRVDTYGKQRRGLFGWFK